MRRASLFTAAAAAAGLCLPAAVARAECPPAGCSQEVTVSNGADNHAETHSDNGGLSSRGGKIALQTSTSAARSDQAAVNKQILRARRGSQARRQHAALVNSVHNNSAATSANTGESSTGASTTTGATDSGVSSTQAASNLQTIEETG
jgi:hypothetical protein